VNHLWQKISIVLVVALAIGGVASCALDEPVTESPLATPDAADTPSWMEIGLTDVATGETFKISDFKGKPILLESFAVWCPTCLAQQKEMKQAKQIDGEDIIHISLDTDPNEDEAKVREHIERNGLDWYFAVSPVELTQALIDEFGLNVVSAPRAPVVLICEDQSTRFLRSGIKTTEELISEVKEGCQ
jgi:thiol-disulfide isomerase/thioredoxin